MPLWDTDNTCTPVPTLPCTHTEDTHEFNKNENGTFSNYAVSIYHPHRCREQTGEVYFPCFSCCSDYCLFHVLFYWIHVLLNPMFICDSHRNSWMSERCVCGLQHTAWKVSTGRTDRLPKRAFIFCLSSRVMRTHASDRVSFTICRRQ